MELTEVENMHHQNIDTLQNDIERLLNERRQLQQFVSRFKNSNEKYLQIKDVAEEHVNRLLTEEEPLLDLALKAVIEALRLNPNRYAIIYNSRYGNNDIVLNNNTNTAAAVTYPSSPYSIYYIDVELTNHQLWIVILGMERICSQKSYTNNR